MDGLELDVRQRRPDQLLERNRTVVEKALKVGHRVRHSAGRRWDEVRQTRARAADPVLGAPELPGVLVGPAALGEEHPVDLPE